MMGARRTVAGLLMLLAACTGSPAVEPNVHPSNAPSASPSASLEGRLVFERRDTPVGMEAPYAGTFVVDGEGNEDLVPMDQLPVDSAGAVWSPDGTQLLFTDELPSWGP